MEVVHDKVDLPNVQSSKPEQVDPSVDHIKGSNYYKPGYYPPDEVVKEVDSRDKGTPDEWIPRHPELVRLTGRHPFNVEPPIVREFDHGFISPTSLHYVRNHGAVPTNLDWDTHVIKIGGLVDRPMEMTMAQLTGGDFEIVTLPVTLVCAGNRRKEENVVKQGLGFSWGPAAVSTSLWTGVWLKDILKHVGIKSIEDGANHVCLVGTEKLPGGLYGTSIRREVALSERDDVLIAFEQNGKRLTPDHGYPVRVIIPGYIGGRMIKWLADITVTAEESDNYYHYFDNRVLPPQVDAERALSEGWWYKPQYIINELNVNSATVYPAHNEVLPIAKAQTYTIKGYCYGGGGIAITRMEVSFDDGDTWELCDLMTTEKPRPTGKHWCWVFWQYEVDVVRLLNCKEILCRGWQGQNTQPNKLTWNLLGMMNNSCFRVKIHPHRVEETGEMALKFEHPTQPGAQPGGWMLRKYPQQAVATVKKEVAKTGKTFTLEDVAKHDKDDDCWIVVEGKVYDVTKFLDDHPGGKTSITMTSGEDSTDEFNALHSEKARDMLADYLVGDVVASDKPATEAAVEAEDTASNGVKVTLQGKKKVALKLKEREELTHNSRRFRFALPSEEHLLGLPVGKHFFVSGTWKGEHVIRAYTPTTGDEVAGYVDLVIKVYNPCERFPEGGKMSQLLDSLAIGDTIDVKGPLGEIEYHGDSKWTIHEEARTADKIAMLAGGTGITPMYQVAKESLANAADSTQFWLVYANVSEDDILLKDELDALAKAHPDRFRVWYTVDTVVRPDEWKCSSGYIDEQMLRDHLPPPGEHTVALMCGPPPMLKYACTPNLEKLGYMDTHVFKF